MKWLDGNDQLFTQWNRSSLNQAAISQSGARCLGVSGIPEFCVSPYPKHQRFLATPRTLKVN